VTGSINSSLEFNQTIEEEAQKDSFSSSTLTIKNRNH